METTGDWGSDSWAGITTALYPSDYNQERSKYIDIWLYTNEIEDENMELNIDIGYISEDINGDNILNSEDQAIFGNIGNNILEDGEDTGYDGCLDLYENGNGSCLSTIDGTFTSICNSITDQNILNDWRYYVIIGSIPNINYDLCNELQLDSDGLHIAALLCALFVRHYRPLVHGGRIYVAMPPLYRIDMGKEVYYARDDEERAAILGRLEIKKNKEINVQRFKGLGEMNPSQLRETTLEPTTRRLIQLSIDNDKKTETILDMLLGKKRAADRRQWLQRKGNLVQSS